MSLLYSNEGTNSYPIGVDRDEYSVSSHVKTAEEVDSDDLVMEGNDGLYEVKMLLPQGATNGFSIGAGSEMLVCSKHCEQVKYRAIVRGLATKVPGFFFSSYSQVMGFPSVLVSMP